MAKLTLADVAALNSAGIATINANSALIETALENTLSRDGTSPNTMGANLDMNSNRITNLPSPSTGAEPATKTYADNNYDTLLALIQDIEAAVTPNRVYADDPFGSPNQIITSYDSDSNVKASGYTIIDEDDMVSNLDTAVPTQQSVKAYVDSAVLGSITVADTSEIDLTIAGGQISGVIVAGSIDETKLDASTNASLDLADSAVQPAAIANMLETTDIGVTVQAYDADLASWAGVTRAAGFDTFAATPSSANLASLVTDETGSGALVFGTDPTFSNDITVTNDVLLGDGSVLSFNSGQMVIGHNAANDTEIDIYEGRTSLLNPTFQVGVYDSGSGGNNSGTYVAIYSYNDDGYSDGFSSSYSRGHAGSKTIVQSGDYLGMIQGWAWDGSANRIATQIAGYVDGTPSAGNMPGRINFGVNAGGTAVTDRMIINADGAVTPGSNDNAKLGESGNAWGDLFLASGGVINFNAGDVTLTHSTDKLTFAGGNNYTFDVASATMEFNLRRTDTHGSGVNLAYLDFEGKNSSSAERVYARVRGAAYSDTAAAEQGILSLGVIKSGTVTEVLLHGNNAALYPSTNDTFALGTSSASWSDLFLASGGVINFNAGNVTLTHTAGTLTLAGALTMSSTLSCRGEASIGYNPATNGGIYLTNDSTYGKPGVTAVTSAFGFDTLYLNKTAGKDVAVGASVGTTATEGFLYVPTCAGTPTGTPTGVTGCAPIVVDTTNNKLYFYSGGAWRDAGP